MKPSMLVYRVLRAAAAAFCALYWRLRIEGVDNVPTSGPFVLAPVHRSNVDFMVAAMVSKQRVRFMAKDSLWKVPVLRGLMELLGAFPIRRGTADREALRRCIEVLTDGEPLAVFPEGTRRDGPLIENLFEGAAYLSLRANVPIVPVGIGGSAEVMAKGSKWMRPRPVRLVVGKPIFPTPHEGGGRTKRSAVHGVTEALQKELQALFDQAQLLAGVSGRYPDGVGR